MVILPIEHDTRVVMGRHHVIINHGQWLEQEKPKAARNDPYVIEANLGPGAVNTADNRKR
ncbi:MAG: hypothetical protein CSB22_00680 [Deltaproteobacteria bacterium]|nr:MAG: hypothetical protein CSB22_00680 [Deltaproteobacteria bacterium]